MSAGLRLLASGSRLRATAAALLVLAAPAADARRKPRVRKETMRAEENPRLKGDAKAFAHAQVKLVAPADLAVLDPAPEALRVEVKIEGYALRPPLPSARLQPYALILVDNEVALRFEEAGAYLLRGLKPGPHSLRLLLSRPWGEVVKAPGAFALTRFWLGPRLEGKAGHGAEAAVWPDPKRPILTYVFPLGDPRPDDPTLLPELGTTEPASATDAGPASASASASAPALRLDFFLTGATLRRRGRGDKLRVVLDKKELPLVREWKPAPLKLKPGRHQLTIDLLDRRGTKVRNAVNRSDRAFTVPAPQ